MAVLGGLVLRIRERSETDSERRDHSVSNLFEYLTPGAFLYIDCWPPLPTSSTVRCWPNALITTRVGT
jgi:hypothetical protein